MPKGTRNVRFSFDETHLTHFGGMWLIQRFCKQLGLKKRLQDYVRVAQRHQNYRPSELFLALLFAIIMGLRRINKTEILQYNGAFLEMLGLRGFPDQSTLRRFLKRLPPLTIRQLVRLHDSLRASLFALPTPRTTLVFDLDSVVLVIYGHQAGARIGYNPKKRGRRSYLIRSSASRRTSKSSGMGRCAPATRPRPPARSPSSGAAWRRYRRRLPAPVSASAWMRASTAAR